MKENEAPLTLKDRVDFPYILANQMLTFQKALLAEEFSEREIQETILGFVHVIPDTWKDNEFRKELEVAEKKVKVDKRPFVVPSVRLSEELCLELGVPSYVEETEVNYFQYFQACINLLQRRGLLTKIHRVEMLEGVDFDTVAIPPPI